MAHALFASTGDKHKQWSPPDYLPAAATQTSKGPRLVCQKRQQLEVYVLQPP